MAVGDYAVAYQLTMSAQIYAMIQHAFKEADVEVCRMFDSDKNKNYQKQAMTDVPIMLIGLTMAPLETEWNEARRIQSPKERN